MILGWKVGQVPRMGQYLFAKPEVISKLRLYLQGFVLEKEKAPASIGKKKCLVFCYKLKIVDQDRRILALVSLG